MDSADKRKIVGTSILFGLLLIYLSHRLPEEVVFPGHAAYFIITFYLTYPESDKIRHLIVTTLLAFGDMLFIRIIKALYESISSPCEIISKNYRVFFLEFLLLFIVVKMMSKKEIYVEFRNSILRTIVFSLEGFLKARGMIETLLIITNSNGNVINEEVLIQGLIICGIQSTIPGLIYLLDTFFCLDIPLRQISMNGVLILGKTGIVISGIGMIIEFIQKDFPPPLYFNHTPYSTLVIYAYFLFTYGNDSLRYAKHFTRKIE